MVEGIVLSGEKNEIVNVTLEEIQQRLDNGEDPNELYQFLQKIWAERSSLNPEQLAKLRKCVELVIKAKPKQVF